MKNIWIMTLFTVREALARKVFIFFLTISALVILGAILVFSFSDTVSFTSFAQSNKSFGINQAVTVLELFIITPLAEFGLLLAIFSSASFVPIMLEKGNIDLLLSKPVSRPQLLWGKYFGGILVVFINLLFLIVGIWLVISIKFNQWDFNFLLIIFSITFTFAVLYSIIVLFGVVTRSSIFGMMIAYFIFLIISPLLLFAKNNLAFIESGFLKTLVNWFYYFVPKTSELMRNLTIDIASGKGVENFQPIITSFLFLVLMLGLSITIFRKKDF